MCAGTQGGGARFPLEGRRAKRFQLIPKQEKMIVGKVRKRKQKHNKGGQRTGKTYKGKRKNKPRSGGSRGKKTPRGGKTMENLC